jgi:hypothetical protein
MEKDLIDIIEVLNKMPDSDLIKTVKELEKLEKMLNFKAPVWEKYMSKREYATAKMIEIEKKTKPMSVSEKCQNVGEILSYTQKESPDLWHLILSKFRFSFKYIKNYQILKN